MISELSVEHMLLRLRPVNRCLRIMAASRAEKNRSVATTQESSLGLTESDVGRLLDQVDETLCDTRDVESYLELTIDEQMEEQRLRAAAKNQHFDLPIDQLEQSCSLSKFEIQSLLVCSVIEIDPSYGRIFGFILDDMNRQYPCIDLLTRLDDACTREQLRRRPLLTATSKLRRCGFLKTHGSHHSDLLAPLRLGPGVFDFLIGQSMGSCDLWKDRAEYSLPEQTVPASPDKQTTHLRHPLDRLAAELANHRKSDGMLLGLWGDRESAPQDTALQLGLAAGRQLRALMLPPIGSDQDETQGLIDRQLRIADREQAILIVTVDALHENDHNAIANIVSDRLSRCSVPTILTGKTPWRPVSLLSRRNYFEFKLPTPTLSERTSRWSKLLPGIDEGRLTQIAYQYRMSPDEVMAATRVASTSSKFLTNGQVVSVENRLSAACQTVAQTSATRFVTNVRPRRDATDLVLPDDLHRQVLEIADFTNVLPTVADQWGFQRAATGGSGLKCLFTGDPGTGKTLCAEVVANRLSVPLLKVNISDVSSKWIGEGSKNLDAVFREASACRGLLFFDEADGLFGKRGSVRHGNDRYANMEVGHLLQRLEDHDGLVILASNLKDNIDPAFTRRFHVVLHLPRPEESERRRIWQNAFPRQSPIGNDVDLGLVARLDMTGAAIVNAARTAALLAATDDVTKISMEYVVRGIERQYQREARVLTPAELGRFSHLLQAAS